MEDLAKLMVKEPEEHLSDWIHFVQDADWNEMILFLAKDHSLETWAPQYKIDLSTRKLTTRLSEIWNEEIEKQISVIPLPNKKVHISRHRKDNGMTMGSAGVAHECFTLGDILNLVRKHNITLVEGWPVPRRFGQNVGRFAQNSGLRVVIQYQGVFSSLLE